MSFTDLDQRCVQAIRGLCIDAIEQARSGHPGLPLGAAPMAYVLWQRFLRHDPNWPSWPNRDRFVLSAGHGSMLLYALLHLCGYDLPMEELRRFRQWESRTPGHPEFGHTAGVEATTGPLGQGSANAVGMAIAERYLAARFNTPAHTLVDHFTYALVSDGDLMEGISAEAASLAGHLGLGKLIYLYDANLVSLDGPTDLTFTEDVAARYRAYGWQVLEVADGDTDLEAISRAIEAARADDRRPSLILVRTTIGFGSPNKAGSSKSHGAPLGAEETKLTKRALGLDPESAFQVDADVAGHLGAARSAGADRSANWKATFEAWADANPRLAAHWRLAQAGELPAGWDEELPAWETGAQLATREAGGAVLAALAERIGWLFGGDADLSESTKTALPGGGSFEGQGGSGRNVHYGVREHAMGAIANGIAYHGGLRTYTATFFCFADYMRPAMRLAAMNRLPVIYVFTHDSVAVGEDGPTHQPVEHLASLRILPGLVVLRPGDANETREAWKLALARTDGPTALVLTRQKLGVIDRSTRGAPEDTGRGAYVLSEAPDGEARAVLIATGSEVGLALETQALLNEQGLSTRVVSMPSWELFAAQDASYRQHVLPPSVRLRVSLEAASTFGWQRWIGDGGLAIGIDRYGASAPGDEVLERLGFTPRAVADRILAHAKG